MSDLNLSTNIDKLSAYFAEGGHNYNAVGLEVEHFLVYSDTKEAVPYNGDFGIVYILRELSAFYPDAKVSSKGPLLGFRTDRFDITLEPAGQFEISIDPFEEINTIRKIYTTFRDYLDEVMQPFGYECITMGYQPYSKASELSLIPKKRYEFMDRYFQTSGQYGMNMMRATASTQVSIDYSDEADFRSKIQAAYFLSPYLKLLTDNCPVFEGKDNTTHLLRSKIWNGVDEKRCGVIPGVMNSDFGFKDYASYILNMPPVFIPDTITGNDSTYTGETPAYECIGDAPLSDKWITHIISMAFPDIRLKNYIEIRVADSMPGESIFAYVALLKGLLYSKEFLDYTKAFIAQEHINEVTIRTVTDNLAIQGWEGVFYNVPIKDAHRSLIKSARKNLSSEESEYLDVLNRQFS